MPKLLNKNSKGKTSIMFAPANLILYFRKNDLMKIKLLFVFSFLYILAFSQTTKKVYFIGNSYTAVNNLPQLIKQVANSTGDDLNYQEYTPGGSTLKQHSTNPAVIATINDGSWDYVVLQEQSQIPSFPLSYVQAELFPYATQLVNQVKNNNACGNVIFYMTWGRKNGDASNCSPGSPLCTYAGMDDKIYDRYMQMGLENESLVSPVGKVWRALRQQYPALELYQSDESHPSYLGSMAAAYTFYTTIFKKDPTLLPFNGNLSSADALILKQVVKNVVFNNMDTYFINSNDVNAKFSATITNGQTVQFQNQSSSSATTFFWDFGDGTTSNVENPTHTYAATGNYTVQFTTNACGRTTTKHKELVISALNVNETESTKVLIYPNPTKDYVIINSKDKISNIEIYDSSGRKLTANIKFKNDEYTIDFKQFEVGNYILRYESKGKSVSRIIQKN